MASGGSGVKTDALGGYGTASGEADNAYGIAAPIYGQMARAPQGYTPQQMADLQTAATQGVGGSTAGAVGQGALQSARTNNAGGYQAAIDAAARGGQQQQSQDDLNIQNQNVNLQNEHQEEGLKGLSGIYDDANSTALGYLGQANQAKPGFWQQFGTKAAFGALGAAQGGGGGS